MIARCEYEKRRRPNESEESIYRKEKNVQMNLLNLEQRDWRPNLSTKDKKNANELSECREKRLFNQCQYQKEKIKNESADHIRQGRLANQHQYQNEKNAYSATITDEIRKFMLLPRVHLLWYKHSVITAENLRLSNPAVEKYLQC